MSPKKIETIFDSKFQSRPESSPLMPRSKMSQSLDKRSSFFSLFQKIAPAVRVIARQSLDKISFLLEIFNTPSKSRRFFDLLGPLGTWLGRHVCSNGIFMRIRLLTQRCATGLSETRTKRSECTPVKRDPDKKSQAPLVSISQNEHFSERDRNEIRICT